MSMTLRQIREHTINACGQTSEATAEFFDLCTGAIRELYAVIEVPELEVENQRRTVAVGKDRIPFTEDVFAIHHIFNVTTGERVEPEEDGMRGRSRYLEETTGQPPSGTVYRYVRSGKNILLRDKADVATTLMLSYKLLPKDLTSADLDNPLPAPGQYDWPGS